ncbi:MAG: VOC family protein [Planctomycetes bacterium]|nr:VOC family protein [Planctomycetota bacterium]
MVQNPPEGYARVIPYLLYEDAGAAIDFLCKAFGFEEKLRMDGPDGSIMHAEVAIGGDGVVMLATAPTEIHGRPVPPGLARETLTAVYVDDVDATFARAAEAGAEVLEEPADQFYGDRTCRFRDPEGHEWNFMTHVKDVDPEDMQPPS